ncbi:MAG: outer membrane beta-barrel protein [Niabella sp.]
MQNYFLLCLFLGITSFLTAQRPQTSGGQMPSGIFYGKVVDSANGKPLEAVSIQLLQSRKDSVTKKDKEYVVTGALTDTKGEFRIEDVPAMGKYKLQISGIGYLTQKQDFSFLNGTGSSSNNSLYKDLGNIKLGIDNQVLQGVTVTGGKPAVQLGIDRKIFNVENSLVSAGGTATDVLKTVPSVSVDIDGNVSVRNSSPQIFVDGRPTTLTLDEIPADQIETVEVITNPSAKYDASGGTAGILNIVLKKNKRIGYSGSLQTGIDQRGKWNVGGNFNVRQGKFNFFGNGMYNQRKSIGSGETIRTSSNMDSLFTMNQNDKTINEGSFRFLRAGFDYFLDNRNTITISGLLMGGNFSNLANSTIATDTSATGFMAGSTILRETVRDFEMRNKGLTFAYMHNFPNNGHQLTADVNYFKNKNNNLSNITNDKGSQSVFQQLQSGNGNSERITAQVDYANPITKNGKFESGIRLNQMQMSNQNDLFFVLSSSNIDQQWPLSTRFNYTDRVLAGYVNFSDKIGENFGYQIGVRAENSSYNGVVTSFDANATPTLNNFNIQYPISLFPSIFLSQQLKNDQSLQLNYSRRINRPGFFELFPFVMDYSDSLNISRGNATLRPEFTNSFELSYSKNFDKQNSLIISTYYKYTNNLITRYQTRETDPISGREVYVNTYLNANSGTVGGFEAIAKNSIRPWWSLTSNLNIYTSNINTKDLPVTTVGQIWSWFAKVNNDFKLPKNFTAQITGEYTSKRVLSPGGSGSNSSGRRGFMGGSASGNAQGYSMPNFDVDASLKYDFLKNKAASVTLSVRDIFRSDVNDVYTFTPYYDQRTTRRRDQQFFRLTFTYRFGKFDASLFKRKNTRADQEGMSSGMEGM